MKSRAPLTYVVLVLGVAAGVHGQTTPAERNLEFAGSQACQTCHQNIYDRWKDTLMANILVDVKERPEVILGDFSKSDPLAARGRSTKTNKVLYN